MPGPVQTRAEGSPFAAEFSSQDQQNEIMAGSLVRFLKKYTVTSDNIVFTVKKRSHFKQADSHDIYFRDRRRKIDLVLAFEQQKLMSPVELAYISEFIRQLEIIGLEFEMETGVVEPMIFVKCHIPRPCLEHFANVSLFELGNPSRPYVESKRRFPWLKPSLAKYKDHMLVDFMGAVSRERIIVLSQVMEVVHFGRFELFSLKRMLDEGYISKAYPLHDSGYQWPERPPYSSRQVLMKHWSNFRVWYMFQPLDLIKQYYGVEMAFYFAWYGYYNVMLIPASIMGVLVTLVPLLRRGNNVRLKEICTSDKIICPSCYSSSCVFGPLKEECVLASVASYFDNMATPIFTVFMVIWGVVFCRLWERRSSVLRLKWYAEGKHVSGLVRTEFNRQTRFRRISPITGLYDAYVPVKVKLQKTIVTILTCTVMVIFMMVVAWTTNVLALHFTQRIPKHMRKYLSRYTNLLFAFVMCLAINLFISFFRKTCDKMAVKLTNNENPRTESEYHYAVVAKMLILYFFNNYTVLFYLTIVMSLADLITSEAHSTNIFMRKQCFVFGCMFPIAIQLFSFYIFRFAKETFYEICKWKCYQWRHKRGPAKAGSALKVIPTWEKEYNLKMSSRFTSTSDFMDVMIQYGLVVLFSTALPLAPLLALINNVFHLRVLASRVNCRRQRTVPVRVEGIQMLDSFFDMLSYMGIFTTGFIVSFSSDLGPSYLWHSSKGTMEGFALSMISKFAVRHYPSAEIRKAMLARNISYCYYRGYRYPPDHANRYQVTEEFWNQLITRLAICICVEHVLIVLVSLLSFMIPSIPLNVKLLLSKEREAVKQLHTLYKDEESKQKDMGKSRIFIDKSFMTVKM